TSTFSRLTCCPGVTIGLSTVRLAAAYTCAILICRGIASSATGASSQSVTPVRGHASRLSGQARDPFQWKLLDSHSAPNRSTTSASSSSSGSVNPYDAAMVRASPSDTQLSANGTQAPVSTVSIEQLPQFV